MSLSKQSLLKKKTGIGGTDIAAICGLNSYKKPIDVYLRLTDQAEPDFTDSTATRIGNFLEPAVAREYQIKRGGEHLCHLAGPFETESHPERGWQVFTLDRLVLPAGPIRGPVTASEAVKLQGKECKVLEIKTAGFHTSKKFGAAGSDDLPLAYLCQVAWYMSALDLDSADVAAILNTNDYREFHVQRDKELEAMLLEKAEAFMKLVEKRTPPPPDGSASFENYLNTRFQKSTELTKVASSEICENVRKLRKIRALQKFLDSESKLLEQIIKNDIEDYEALESDTGILTYKFQKGRVSNAKLVESFVEKLGLSHDELKREQEMHRSAGSRVLRVPRSWESDSSDFDVTKFLEK
jgi:putative phage-type endonuclease